MLYTSIKVAHAAIGLGTPTKLKGAQSKYNGDRMRAERGNRRAEADSQIEPTSHSRSLSRTSPLDMLHQ